MVRPLQVAQAGVRGGSRGGERTRSDKACAMSVECRPFRRLGGLCGSGRSRRWIHAFEASYDGRVEVLTVCRLLNPIRPDADVVEGWRRSSANPGVESKQYKQTGVSIRCRLFCGSKDPLKYRRGELGWIHPFDGPVPKGIGSTPVRSVEVTVWDTKNKKLGTDDESTSPGLLLTLLPRAESRTL